MEPVFTLFASCIPVRGARRSTLCDLQRQTYRLIPNGLYEILTAHRGKTVAEIKAAYGGEFDGTIDEYFAFLEEGEFGFFTDDPGAFPPLDLSYDAPEHVSNAIIDTGPDSRHDYASLFRQLEDLGCRAVQLRFFADRSLEELEAIVGLLATSRIRSVEVIAKHQAGWTEEEVERLCRRHPRLASVTVHSAPHASARAGAGGAMVTFRTEAVTSASHCGQVHPRYFVVGMQHFTEAQRFNTCLNRKIGIGEDGGIRNCPSLPATFGNAADTPLRAALLTQGFRDLWAVGKDQVETCRDCEFRYVCTDCRAYVRDPGDRFSKPAKCAYDPYTMTWGAAPAAAG